MGTAAGLGVDAVSFAASAGLLASIGPLTAERSDHVRSASAQSRLREPTSAPLSGRLLGGARAILRSKTQRRIQLLVIVLNLVSSSVVLLVISLVRQSLQGGATATGAVLAGAGAGGLVSSIIVAPRIARRMSWGRATALLLLIASVGLFTLAVSPNVAIGVLGNLLLDGGVAGCFIIGGSARQATTEPAMLGQVAAASYLLSSASRGVGALAAGLSLGALGPRPTLIAAATGVAIAAGLLARGSVPGLRVQELRGHERNPAFPHQEIA